MASGKERSEQGFSARSEVVHIFVGGLLFLVASAILCSDISPLYSFTSPLETIIKHDYTVISISFSIVLCVPLLIDLLFDVGYYSAKGIFLTSRLILVLCNALPAIAYFALVDSSHQKMAVIFATLCAYRECAYCTYIYSVLSSSITDRWPYWGRISITISFCCTKMLSLLAAVPSTSHRGIEAGYWMFDGIGYGLALVLGVRYLLFVKTVPSLPPQEYLVILYTIFTILYGAYNMLNPVSTDKLSLLRFDVPDLIRYNVLLGISLTFCVMLPGRTAKSVGNELKRINESKLAFVRHISHEIRTPANICSVGVGIVIDVLRDNKMYKGETREVLGQVQEALFAISETLNNLLEFEKINTNDSKLNKTPIAPVKFVRDTLRLLQTQAKQNGITLQLPNGSKGRFGDLEKCLIDVDWIRMGQALRNFVSNAIRFTPLEGNIRVTTSPFCSICAMDKANHTFTPHSQRPWLRIDVVDSGQGLDSEALLRLERSLAASANHSVAQRNLLEPGQALGFSVFVSSSIVHNHGGRVCVHSAGPGLGSTFSIELPLLASSTDAIHIHEDYTNFPLNGMDLEQFQLQQQHGGVQHSQSQSQLQPHQQQHQTKSWRSSGRVFPSFHSSPRESSNNPHASGRSSSAAHLSGRSISSTAFALGSMPSFSPSTFMRGASTNINNRSIASLSLPSNRALGAPQVNTPSPDSAQHQQQQQQYGFSARIASSLSAAHAMLSMRTPTSQHGRSPSSANEKNSCNLNNNSVSLNNNNNESSALVAISEYGDDIGVQYVMPPDSMTKDEVSINVTSYTKQQERESTVEMTPLVVEAAPPADKNASAVLTGKWVLCVDDSTVNLKMTAMLFRKFGAVVEQAVNGKEAVDMVRASLQRLSNEGSSSSSSFSVSPQKARVYDMVVMDNFMPIMTGPVACRAMRNLGYAGPIFGLTGHVLAVDMADYSKAGADHIFKKPLRVKELMEVLMSRALAERPFGNHSSNHSVSISAGGAASGGGGGSVRSNYNSTVNNNNNNNHSSKSLGGGSNYSGSFLQSGSGGGGGGGSGGGGSHSREQLLSWDGGNNATTELFQSSPGGDLENSYEDTTATTATKVSHSNSQNSFSSPHQLFVVRGPQSNSIGNFSAFGGGNGSSKGGGGAVVMGGGGSNGISATSARDLNLSNQTLNMETIDELV